MNKRVYRFWLAVAALFVIIALIVAINYNRQKTVVIPDNNVPDSRTELILKEYMGEIGVFKPDEGKPFMKIEVFVDTLPNYDKLMLKGSGIRINEADLQKAVEDYES